MLKTLYHTKVIILTGNGRPKHCQSGWINLSWGQRSPLSGYNNANYPTSMTRGGRIRVSEKTGPVCECVAPIWVEWMRSYGYIGFSVEVSSSQLNYDISKFPVGISRGYLNYNRDYFACNTNL